MSVLCAGFDPDHMSVGVVGAAPLLRGRATEPRLMGGGAYGVVAISLAGIAADAVWGRLLWPLLWLDAVLGRLPAVDGRFLRSSWSAASTCSRDGSSVGSCR